MASMCLSALLLVGFSTAEAAQDLWVWGGALSPLHGEGEEAAFLSFAAEQAARLGTALVEHEGLASNASALQNFIGIASLASPPFQVSALYGWSGSSGSNVPVAKVLDWVDAAMVLRKLAVSTGDAPLAAISLDIEPKKPPAFQQYADLLLQIRSKLDAAGKGGGGDLQFDIAAAWAFSLHNVTCGIKGNMTLMHCALGLVDRYTLMNYRNSAHGCSCRPSGKNPAKFGCVNGSVIPTTCEIIQYPDPPAKDGMIGKSLETAKAIAGGARARLALGVETSCGIGQYTYKLSFCGTSTNYMSEQQALTEQYLKDAGLWDTVMDKRSPWVVEDYKALKALEKANSLHANEETV